MGFLALSSLQTLVVCICYCAGQQWTIPQLAFRKAERSSFQHLPWYTAIDGQGISEHFSTLNSEELQNNYQRPALQGSHVDYCVNDTFLILSEFTQPKPKIGVDLLRFVDASSKIPNGILSGNMMWVGEYQECIAIDPVQNPYTNKTFKGKYFSTVVYQNNIPIQGLALTPLIAGVCFPDSCNEYNVTLLLNILLQEAGSTVKSLNLSISGAFTEKKQDLSGGTLTTIVITGILIGTIILGTLIDLISRETKNKPKPDQLSGNDESDTAGLLTREVFSDSGDSHLHVQEGRCSNNKRILTDLLCAFSFLSNAKKLFGTETANGPLACLNGIRVLSMWWVILGHTFAFIPAFLDNPVEATKLMERFTFQPILNGTFSVDSFFFLSGLLVAYLALKEIKDKGMKPSFWMYFVCHRYWRLTPLYGYVILIYVYVMRQLVSGPYTAYLTGFNPMIDECKSSWWANLLYINNFYPYYGSLQKTCLGWSWYLANDMQCYLILGPLVIVLLSRDRRGLRWIGIILTICLIIFCILSRGILVIYYGIYGLSGSPTKHIDEPLAKNGPLYARPFSRWSVYLVGMLVGYALASRNNRIRIPKVYSLIGWLVCIPVALAVIYGQYYYSHHPGTHMSMTQSVFYVSLCRYLWSLCLAWVVLACVAGKAWLVKDILSWKIWAPLGRLTYAAYLIHPILIYTVLFNQLRPIHYTDFNMVYLFLGNLVLSYALAFILSMLVEAPMIQLEKAITKHIPKGSFQLNVLSRIQDRFRR